MTVGHWLFGVVAISLSFTLMMRYFRLHQLLKPNVILVMYVCHLAQQMGASIFLLGDTAAVAAPIFFVACAATALLIPIGGLIGHAILPVRQTERLQFQQSMLYDDFRVRRVTWLFFSGLFAFCLMLFVFYIRAVPSSPLLNLVTGAIGGGIEAQLARRDGDVGALGRVFGMGIVFFMPLLFLMSLIGLGYFRSWLARLLCLPALAIAIVYNGWAMDKSTVAMLFLLALIVLMMRKQEVASDTPKTVLSAPERHNLRRKRRRLRMLLGVFIVLMIGYPVFIFTFTLSDEKGLGYMVAHVFLRLVYKPAINSYTAFEAFTYHWNFTYFTDVKRFVDLVGLPYFDMSERIAVYKGQDAFNNAPPTAIGNFYGQGGWIVLIGGVLFASALFKVIENWFYRVGLKTPVHLATYALLLYGAFRFSWANYHTILMTETIVPMFLVLAFWAVMFRLPTARRWAVQ